MLKDILIVDGYNVIFAWTHLKKLAHESLEHARMELRDRLLNYGKFKGYEVILVFDGKYTKSGGSVEAITSGFLEVYTEDGETADSFIGAEQNQILGSGGLRIPARELQNMIRMAKEEERLQYAHEHRRDQFSLRRNEVGGLLSPEVAEKLEKLRRGH